MKLAVKNLENKNVGEITLDESVFGVEVRNDILHRMVNYQLHKRRAGTHKVKDRSEVRGTGKKAFKQKGTGNARTSDLQGPIHRGGGIVFGPQVRSHAIDLPKKIRRLALKMALSAKNGAGKIVILDAATAKTHKTKPMAEAFKGFGIDSALVIAGSEIDANFARATSNLPRIDVLPMQGINVYDILRRDTLVLTKDAVNDLTEKLKG